MERNKKNALMTAADSAVKKSSFVEADAGGGVTARVSDGSKQKIPAEINGPKGPEPTRYGDWE